jgi:hypothetical protein
MHTLGKSHFEGANIKGINLIEKVDGFAKERLLHPLEALSWICKLEWARCALLTVNNLLVLCPAESGTDELLQKPTPN